MSAPTTTTASRARVLSFDGSHDEIPRDQALAAARAGAVVVVDGLLTELGFLDTVRELYLDEIGATVSPSAAEAVRERGLERLHEVLDPPQVAAMLVALDRRVRPLIVPVAEGIVDAITGGRPGPHWICDRMWVRAQVPYTVLTRHPDVLGAGHLQGHISPIGPHRDFWLTHPRGALSFWAAVGTVTPANTIELFDDYGDPSRRTVDTTGLRGLRPALAPGDVLVFDSDRLHASVRNDTTTTRVSIGTRVLSRRRLRYGPGVHWRPFLDARLVATPFARLASLRSRLTVAALRRARWRRRSHRKGGPPIPPRGRA